MYTEFEKAGMGQSDKEDGFLRHLSQLAPPRGKAQKTQKMQEIVDLFGVSVYCGVGD